MEKKTKLILVHKPWHHDSPKIHDATVHKPWYHGNDAVLGRHHDSTKFHDATVCTNIMEMLPYSYREQNLQNRVIMV